MGLFRLLFWIVLIAAAFWLWRRLTRKRPERKVGPDTLPMVRCAHCGIHVPREQAIEAQDQWYCSRAHLEQGSKLDGR